MEGDLFARVVGSLGLGVAIWAVWTSRQALQLQRASEIPRLRLTFSRMTASPGRFWELRVENLLSEEIEVASAELVRPRKPAEIALVDFVPVIVVGEPVGKPSQRISGRRIAVGTPLAARGNVVIRGVLLDDANDMALRVQIIRDLPGSKPRWYPVATQARGPLTRFLRDPYRSSRSARGRSG